MDTGRLVIISVFARITSPPSTAASIIRNRLRAGSGTIHSLRSRTAAFAMMRSRSFVVATGNRNSNIIWHVCIFICIKPNFQSIAADRSMNLTRITISYRNAWLIVPAFCKMSRRVCPGVNLCRIIFSNTCSVERDPSFFNYSICSITVVLNLRASTCSLTRISSLFYIGCLARVSTGCRMSVNSKR